MSDETPPVPPAPGTPPMTPREAKAAAKAAKAYAKASRPFWKKKRFIIPVVLIVIGIGVAASGGGDETEPERAGETDTDKKGSGVDSDFSTNKENPPGDDVEIVSCEVDEFGLVSAVAEITNHSSKESDYLITMNVERGGTVVGEAFGSQDNVDAGQSAQTDVVGTVSGEGGDVTCILEEVERFAS
jgi:hypothetical protein